MQAVVHEAGVSAAGVLALQCAGAALGGMVCMPSIAAARAALAVAGFADVTEGAVLRRCWLPLVGTIVTATVVAVPFVL